MKAWIKYLTRSRYRICRDSYMGYEVQKKFCWWPWWFLAAGCNTFSSARKAELFARELIAGNCIKEIK